MISREETRTLSVRKIYFLPLRARDGAEETRNLSAYLQKYYGFTDIYIPGMFQQRAQYYPDIAADMSASGSTRQFLAVLKTVPGWETMGKRYFSKLFRLIDQRF